MRQYIIGRTISCLEWDPIEYCCDPVLVEPLEEAEAETLAAGFRVLADPTRLRLLSLIANAPDGEMCACDVTAPGDESTHGEPPPLDPDRRRAPHQGAAGQMGLVPGSPRSLPSSCRSILVDESVVPVS